MRPIREWMADTLPAQFIISSILSYCGAETDPIASAMGDTFLVHEGHTSHT